MSSICVKCEKTIERRKTPSLSCAGFCGRLFHTDCAGIPSDVCKHLKTPGLYWFCESCSKLKNDYESVIRSNLEDKMKDLVSHMQGLFNNVKDEILEIAKDKLANFSIPMNLSNTPETTKPSYSQVASSKSMIVVKPKNITQSNTQTKTDIMQNLNPVDLELQVSKVKNIRNGGILIGCSNAGGVDRFKKLANEKLSASYEIQELKNLKPKLKVVGMSQVYTEEELIKYLKHQNNVFSDSSNIKVLKMWCTKNKKDVYQAVIGMDPQEYLDILRTGSIYINYDVCSVYDAIDLKICFKCSGFNHLSKSCTSNITSCPKCSLNHDIKTCPSNSKPKCINCLKAKIPQDDHYVWDADKCGVYKIKLQQYKSSIFSYK